MHIRLLFMYCFLLIQVTKISLNRNKSVSSFSQKPDMRRKETRCNSFRSYFYWAYFFRLDSEPSAAEKGVYIPRITHTSTHIYICTYIQLVTRTTNRVLYMDAEYIRNAHRISHTENKLRFMYYILYIHFIYGHTYRVSFFCTHAQILAAKKPFLASTSPKHFLTKKHPREKSEFY